MLRERADRLADSAVGGERWPRRRIPRWRGFNLQGQFSTPQHPYDGPAYDEFDFVTMREWGFDFARLPLNYYYDFFVGRLDA